MKFKENDHVKFKNTNTKYKNIVFRVYGYANPGYDDLVYLIDKHNRIITTSENSIELVLEKMEYLGFKSTPIFDEESQIYHGHVEEIRELVTWESDTLEGCEDEFHKAVLDYIQFKESIKNSTGRLLE